MTILENGIWRRDEIGVMLESIVEKKSRRETLIVMKEVYFKGTHISPISKVRNIDMFSNHIHN